MKPLLGLKLWLRSNPSIFKLVYPHKEKPHFKARVVRPGDDVVIEGYPRSSNTFATYAFMTSQPDPAMVGNHFHTPAQFHLARAYKIPAMLVIRNPIDACSSMMLFDGKMDAEEALRRYIAFHRPLVKIRDSFVAADFDHVTSDFGRCIDALNARFNTRFVRFDHTPENTRRVMNLIASDRAKRADQFGDVFRNPLRTTTPTPEKAARKRAVTAQFGSPGLQRLRARAERLYHTLSSASASDFLSPASA